MRRALLALILLAGIVGAHAQVYVVAPKSDGQLTTSVIAGTYTVATLPSAATNTARYAFVTDLGGGADMVLSDGTYWKHIRQGVVTTVAGSGSVTLTPLVTPPIIQLTGSNLASMSVTITQTNLYPGETFRILTPSGVLSTLGTFGVHVDNISGSLPLLPGSWQDFQWNGTTLVKIAGGSL